MTRPKPAAVDERLLEWCPVAFFRQRIDFSFEYISPKIQEWTGVSADEWRENSRFLQQLIHNADVEGYFRRSGDVKATQAASQICFRIRHRETEKLTALLETRRAIRDATSSVTGFEGSWTEIPLEYFDASWRDAYNALALGASHEFNNKLTAIVSLSDLFLSDVGANSSMAPGLKTMRSTAYGISEVLHQLAAQYFAQTGRRELVDLNATVNEVSGLLRRCVSSRIEVTCAVHKAPLPITVDAVWLRRVLLILAVMATKRIPESGTVALASSGGSHAAVALRMETFNERSLVSRPEEERSALDEAARFASAHRGAFTAADDHFMLSIPLEDLSASQ